MDWRQTYLLSSIASCVAEAVTFPLDFAKTRLQAQTNRSMGMTRIILQSAQQDGIKAVYQGIVPACARHVVYSGSRVTIYEFMREHVLGVSC
mmetsp:Transcript_35357/g.56442  ORF Transcript_35357/g.56442 Transcript_35357/m.56442 type:complete len:92 (+) Transcript_35357:499-774(+)